MLILPPNYKHFITVWESTVEADKTQVDIKTISGWSIMMVVSGQVETNSVDDDFKYIKRCDAK